MELTVWLGREHYAGTHYGQNKLDLVKRGTVLNLRRTGKALLWEVGCSWGFREAMESILSNRDGKETHRCKVLFLEQKGGPNYAL